MRDFYDFDIPNYIRPSNRYYSDMEQATEKYLRKLFPANESPCKKFPKQCELIEHEFRRGFGGPWDFNQIVGWLRLYIEGREIGGHLWWVDAKRLQTRMRKTFYLASSSNVLATWFAPNDDSAKIYAE